MLPHRTIIYVLFRYVVQKQNHALELDISGRLHEREVGLARRKEKLVGLDSFSKDTEMGTWQACVNLIHIKAAFLNYRLSVSTGTSTIVLSGTSTGSSIM